MRENVAQAYGIVLYRRYREKEAARIVGYEATWWKRHRKAGNIKFVQDPGGSINYFGYMLCDLLILGKQAIHRPREPGLEGAPAGAPQSGPTAEAEEGATAIATQIIKKGIR